MSDGSKAFLNSIGFLKVWNTEPSELTFGEPIHIIQSLNNGVSALFLKGVTYFLISVQIKILKSSGFKNFSDTILLDNVKYA